MNIHYTKVAVYSVFKTLISKLKKQTHKQTWQAKKSNNNNNSNNNKKLTSKKQNKTKQNKKPDKQIKKTKQIWQAIKNVPQVNITTFAIFFTWSSMLMVPRLWIKSFATMSLFPIWIVSMWRKQISRSLVQVKIESHCQLWH